jgi:hypothetical protein
MYNENLRLVKPCETCGETMLCENPKYRTCAECASKSPDPMADLVEEMFGKFLNDKD